MWQVQFGWCASRSYRACSILKWLGGNGCATSGFRVARINSPGMDCVLCMSWPQLDLTTEQPTFTSTPLIYPRLLRPLPLSNSISTSACPSCSTTLLVSPRLTGSRSQQSPLLSTRHPQQASSPDRRRPFVRVPASRLSFMLAHGFKDGCRCGEARAASWFVPDDRPAVNTDPRWLDRELDGLQTTGRK